MHESISPKELKKAERIADIIMRIAPFVSLVLIGLAYYLLSVGDLIGAVKVDVSGAEFEVDWKLVDVPNKGTGIASHVYVLGRVYLKDDYETLAYGKIVMLKRGTELKVGISRIELLLVLAPFSVGLFYAARTVYSVSSEVREISENRKRFEVRVGDLSKTAKAILYSIIFGFAAALYLRVSGYFPLLLFYPVVDVTDVAYASRDFHLLMSPAYVVLTYITFAFSVLAAFSVGFLVYSLGRGSKAWIEEIRSGRATP